MIERGKIRNREFASQLRDFSGLRWGSITPTDVDAFIDFGNEMFIFIEDKYLWTQMSRGQRLALERLCDACQASGVDSFLLLASHSNMFGDVDYASLRVTSIRHAGVWTIPLRVLTARQAIDAFRLRLHEQRRQQPRRIKRTRAQGVAWLRDHGCTRTQILAWLRRYSA